MSTETLKGQLFSMLFLKEKRDSLHPQIAEGCPWAISCSGWGLYDQNVAHTPHACVQWHLSIALKLLLNTWDLWKGTSSAQAAPPVLVPVPDPPSKDAHKLQTGKTHWAALAPRSDQLHVLGAVSRMRWRPDQRISATIQAYSHSSQQSIRFPTSWVLNGHRKEGTGSNPETSLEVCWHLRVA